MASGRGVFDEGGHALCYLLKTMSDQRPLISLRRLSLSLSVIYRRGNGAARHKVAREYRSRQAVSYRSNLPWSAVAEQSSDDCMPRRKNVALPR